MSHGLPDPPGGGPISDFRPRARWWLLHGLLLTGLAVMVFGIATNWINGPFRALGIEFPDWIAGLVFTPCWLLAGLWMLTRPSRVRVTEDRLTVVRRIGQSDYPVQTFSLEVVEHQNFGRSNPMLGLRRADTRWRSVIRLNEFADKEREALRQELLSFQRRADQLRRS